jgi:CubicO group peptidase (beta-lactamase class C family)
VTVVSRRGAVHVDTIGTTAIGGRDPMRRDTIFRITSMTKPIAAAAAMILVEECALRLDDPVDRLLPELADRRVLRRLDGPLDDTVPANRPIVVRDLLTFRMGLGVMLGPGDAFRSSERSVSSGSWVSGRPTPRRRTSRTSGCAGSGRCRSCTSRASSGGTTRDRTCWAS